MAESVPETIDKATKAIPVISQNFAVVVAVIALLGVALLVYRDEVRADAQIKVLSEMSQHLSDLDGDFRASGIRVGDTKTKRLAVQAAAVVSP